MTQIYGETVKNAFATRLAELYPEVAIYKEEEGEQSSFPNFFILQLTLNSTEDRKDHYFDTYYITIRYREAADINLVNKIEQKLDRMGVSLIQNLKYIPIEDRKIKLKNCNYEKVDGVVHFFANVTLQGQEERLPQPIMEEIKQDIELL